MCGTVMISFSAHSVFLTAEKPARKCYMQLPDVLCFSIKLSATFEFEAEPQLFLVCSEFLGKFEPHCSYKKSM